MNNFTADKAETIRSMENPYDFTLFLELCAANDIEVFPLEATYQNHVATVLRLKYMYAGMSHEQAVEADNNKMIAEERQLQETYLLNLPQEAHSTGCCGGGKVI